MKNNLWGCEFCGKEVRDNGAGFRFFVEYDVQIDESKYLKRGTKLGYSRQLRICGKCLKTKNYEEIKL